MICPKCKNKIEDSALKCPHCDIRVATLCKKCNAYNKILNQTCVSCGEELLKLCPECKSANLPSAKNCRKCKHKFAQPAFETEAATHQEISAQDQNLDNDEAVIPLRYDANFDSQQTSLKFGILSHQKLTPALHA